MQSWRTVVSDLGSEVCRCGSGKDPKRFFCKGCYFSLPESYRNRLWRRYSNRDAVCLIYTRSLSFLGLLHGKGRVA